MTAASDDLRITSDTLLRDIEALIALEEQKRDIPLDDPEVAELARQIQGIAQRVLVSSRRQEGLTREVAASGQADGEAAPAPTINETPRSVASILSEWRDLERRAASAEAGSAERAEIEILADRLREEYRRAVEAAQHRR